MNIRSRSFFTFISNNLRPPLLDLVPRLGCKNTSRVKIIITISIENRIKSNKNFGHVLRAIFSSSNVHNGLKFGKMNKKVILYTKM